MFLVDKSITVDVLYLYPVGVYELKNNDFKFTFQ